MIKNRLTEWGPAIQAVCAVLTTLIAAGALVGVKWQIEASARQQQDQSARDIYREFLNLSIAQPALGQPDYCAIAGTPTEAVYENYVRYMLYTSDQMLAAEPDWEPALNAHWLAHRDYLCIEDAADAEEAPHMRAALARFRAKHCRQFRSECSAPPPSPPIP